MLIVGGLVAGAQSMQLGDILRQPSLLLMHTRSQGYLGVDVGDVDRDRAQALHLTDDHGAEITVLDHDAPAGKVGLKLHDVILQVDSQTILTAEQLRRVLHAMTPEHKLQLVVSRDGAQQTIAVQLADRRKMEEAAKEQFGSAAGSSTVASGFLAGGGDVPGGFRLPGFGNSLHVGVMVEPLTPQMSDFLGVIGGIMIKSVAHKSAADAAGLKPHDVVLQIGGEPVVTSSDWERLLRSSEGKPVQVEILRDRLKQLVLLQVDGKRHKS
jgi:S1-C subfamily serine protease